jgi:hypothetical protein
VPEQVSCSPSGTKVLTGIKRNGKHLKEMSELELLLRLPGLYFRILSTQVKKTRPVETSG